MTLAEIATFVTSRVGTTDATSVALCKEFTKRRYAMVYDSFLWRDSEMTDTAVTVASTATVQIPTTLDRVISILANGRSLDPVDSTFFAQTDATMFTATGTPVAYEELTDTADSNKRKVRLFPLPDAVYTLKFIGKRVLTNLSADGDSPLIRNIDNVLIAYVTGDMYERMRQVGKAQAKFTEASAMLEAAKALDRQQVNRPRMAKQLTVSGNSLAEMADSVAARVNDYTLDAAIQIKDFVRRNYQTVYDMALWPESTVASSVTSTDGQYLVLPHHFDRIIALRGTSTLPQLSAAGIGALFAITPQIFEQTSRDPYAFSILPPVATLAQPTSALTFEVLSSSSSDKTRMFIAGEDNDRNVYSESVTLNGTTPVGLTAPSGYKIFLTVAKAITTGTITLRQTGFNTVYLQLLPAERERKHIRLWLQPGNPGVSLTCFVLGKRRIVPLSTDEDTPILRSVGNILIQMSVADYYASKGNLPGAQDARKQAEKALQGMIDLEVNQSAVQQVVVPDVEYYESDGIYEDLSFIAKV